MRVSKRFVAVTIAWIAVAAAAVWATARYFPSAPPRTITMFAGPEGGAYFELATRYREYLGRSGIDVRIVSTAGAGENVRRLGDPTAGPSMGFVQGGSAAEAGQLGAPLVSLGTTGYEPLWFFRVAAVPALTVKDFQGRRISIGAEGSGTRILVQTLLAVNRIDPGVCEFVSLAPNEAAEQLLDGRLGAAFFSAAWNSPVVQRLLASDRVALVSFPRADAYVALFPYLTKLTVPMGVADMAHNVPPEDITVVATKSSLVVQRGLDPSLQYLLLEAASEIHARPDLFHASQRFPAPDREDFPLSETARQYYKSGLPWFQRTLPFWLAVRANQALVLLIPLAGVVYPLLRIVPALYAWTMRRRVYKLYRDLKHIEQELESSSGRDGAARVLPHLLELEQRANRMRMPASYAQGLYTLRMHIELVRAELERRGTEVAGGQPRPA
jgi:TRAP transporter TAXI family solute receptor